MKKLKDWLAAEPGRSSALAEHLGVHKSMVSQMVSDNPNQRVRVPPAHYRAIRDFTGGAVSVEDLLPEPDQSTPTEPQAAQEGV